MTYHYTVFLSYHRALRVGQLGELEFSAAGEWVRCVLKPLLTQWLPEYVPDATIAFDGDLPAGTCSRDGIRDMLQRSACMVAVWSMPYFASAWCRAEWQSMLARERAEKCGELVIPVVFCDGDHFDDDAKERTQSPAAYGLQPFTTMGPGYKTSKRFEQLQEQIKLLCDEIRRRSGGAPPFRDDFPWTSPDGLDPRPPFSPPSFRR